MKHKNFYDLRQAEMYLCQSIIMIDDRPALVRSVEWGNYLLLFYKHHNTRTRVIRADSERVDFNPIPLGMTNVKVQDDPTAWSCVYLYRVPSRHFKIGLTVRNCQIKHLAGIQNYYLGPRHFFFTQALENTVLGRYHGYRTVYDRLQRLKTRSSMAFSRRFAIVKEREQCHLVYPFADEPVGQCTEDGPVLFNEYQYLQQRLDEAINV